MLDFALEEYPRDVELEDELMCTVRPLREDDEKALCDFMLGLKPEERLFIKGPCSNSDLFMDWCRSVDYDNNLPLLALEGERIVALGIMHQRQGGWKRHIGSLNMMVKADCSGHGLMLLLIRSLVGLGQHAGLMRLESELMGAPAEIIEAFQDAGFEELARVRDYVMDMEGRTHDSVLMGMNLIPDEELTGAGD
ncbi:MAG: hypothetical protein L3J39_12680 [Verrucomicrobiales bacterium]|nr:hypothetical protein [Verrucomicrobiales bacterium]